MKHLLTDEEAWEVYQANGGRGVPPREQVNSVAQAQYDLLLSQFPKNEDIKVMLFQYTQGERTLESVVEYIKRGTFGDAE